MRHGLCVLKSGSLSDIFVRILPHCNHVGQTSLESSSRSPKSVSYQSLMEQEYTYFTVYKTAQQNPLF